MKSRVYLAGLALAVTAAAAQAGVSVTPTAVSDYDFRGVTQTANDPALQVGVDYAEGPLHLGLWTSNVHFDPTETGFKFFGSKHTEVDFIGDFSGGSDDTVKYNVGFVDYTYPGQSGFDYPEIWGTLSKKWFSASLHYSWDWAGTGLDLKAYYIEANATIPLADTGFSVVAHIGHSWGDYWDSEYNLNLGAYEDYSVGVTKSFGNFSFALKYVDTSGYFDKFGLDKRPASGLPNQDVFSGKGKALLSVSTTLPWASGN
jgi:uncharacterized protein (TIGR02001 family)